MEKMSSGFSSDVLCPCSASTVWFTEVPKSNIFYLLHNVAAADPHWGALVFWPPIRGGLALRGGVWVGQAVPFTFTTHVLKGHHFCSTDSLRVQSRVSYWKHIRTETFCVHYEQEGWWQYEDGFNTDLKICESILLIIYDKKVCGTNNVVLDKLKDMRTTNLHNDW